MLSATAAKRASRVFADWPPKAFFAQAVRRQVGPTLLPESLDDEAFVGRLQNVADNLRRWAPTLL
eukprot:1736034-Lingulodinium_polyedra.AAC.1